MASIFAVLVGLMSGLMFSNAMTAWEEKAYGIAVLYGVLSSMTAVTALLMVLPE